MPRTRISSSKKAESVTKSLKPSEISAPIGSKAVGEDLIRCLRTGDLERFRSILACHIMGTNKLQFAKKIGIERRTLYDLINPNIKFNPQLTTVSAIIRGLCE